MYDNTMYNNVFYNKIRRCVCGNNAVIGPIELPNNTRISLCRDCAIRLKNCIDYNLSIGYLQPIYNNSNI